MHPPEDLTDLRFVPEEHREAARRAVRVAYQLGRIDGTLGPVLRSTRKFAHANMNFNSERLLEFVLEDCASATVSSIQVVLEHMRNAGEVMSDGRGNFVVTRYPAFVVPAAP